MVVRVAQVARIGEEERWIATRPKGSVVAAAGGPYEPPPEGRVKRHHAELGNSLGPSLEETCGAGAANSRHPQPPDNFRRAASPSSGWAKG